MTEDLFVGLCLAVVLSALTYRIGYLRGKQAERRTIELWRRIVNRPTPSKEQP